MMVWRLIGPAITLIGSIVGAAYGPEPFVGAAFGFMVATALRLGIALDRTPDRIDTQWRLRHLFEAMFLGALFAAEIRGCRCESRRYPANEGNGSLREVLESGR